MAETERVTVAFSETIASQIRSAVDAGEYQSPSDVVQDALRLWSENRIVPGEHDVEDLRRAWDAGKASGPLGSLDFEELRREARSRLQAKTALSREAPGPHRVDWDCLVESRSAGPYGSLPDDRGREPVGR